MKRLAAFILSAIAMILWLPRQLVGWSSTIGGGDDDWGVCGLESPDSGYIFLGNTKSFGAGGEDIFFVKTDSEGNGLWMHYYGGKLQDRGASLHVNQDGSSLFLGHTLSITDSLGKSNLWLFKADAEGDTLWQKVYQRHGTDYARCIVSTSDGGYVMLGDDSENPYLWKINANGDSIWLRYYEAEDKRLGYSVCQAEDGGYLICGSSWAQGLSDLWLMRVDADGEVTWEKTHGGENLDDGYSVVPTSDGCYIVTGWSVTSGDNGPELWLLKIDDTSGKSLWTKLYGGGGKDVGKYAHETSDGGYIVVGSTESFGDGGADVWLIKTDSLGDTLWTRTYGGTLDDYGEYVQETSDAGYIITGYTYSFGVSNGKSDLWVIKTDSKGIEMIAEQPSLKGTSDWEVVVPVGSRIVLEYSNLPQGFKASIFDAAGREVDAIYAPESAGSLLWGEGFESGVYFIRVLSGNRSTTRKVVLVR